MAFPNDCGNFFDCSDLKNLTLDQALKYLFKADANGCPALNITGNVDTSGATELIADTPGLTEYTGAGPHATPINGVSFSIFFDGSGGTLNGISVPDGYQVNYGNGFNKLTTALPFTVPTGGNLRVLISTLD